MKFEVQISGSVTKALLATLSPLPITQFCFPTTIASRVAATDCNTPQRLTYVLCPIKEKVCQFLVYSVLFPIKHL